MENYVPRPEFDLLVKTQNGRLGRIESTLGSMDAKLDKTVECVHDRVCREEFTKHQGDVWAAMNTLRRLVYIGVGLVIAVNAVVLPILLVIFKR